VNAINNYTRKHKIVFSVYGLLVAFLIIFAIFAKLTPSYLLDMFRQAAPLGVASIAQTICLLLGGIDLSVGAVISFTNLIACATMLGNPANILPAVLLTVSLSLLIGFINGIMIVKAKIPAFLATLAMSIIIKGVNYIFTKGSPIGSIAEPFRVISEGWLGFLPISGIIWVLIWALISILLYRTTIGRQIYATGGNPQATWLSGIRTERITVAGYMTSSLLACFSGLLISAYIGVASIAVGDSYTLNTIAAACIGGTTFDGGKGGIAGTFAGVMIIFLIQAFMTMMNIPEAGKQISLGLIIIVMVAVNQRVARYR